MAFGTYASVIQGFKASAASPARTALSTLGVVIGVASVITTLALTDGLESFAREQAAANTDVQSITIASKTTVQRDGFSFPLGGYPTFTQADADELRTRLGSAGDVTMLAGGQTVVTTTHAHPHAASVSATLANYLVFGHRDVDVGRYFTAGEVARNAPVVVLSHLLAEQLSPTGDPSLMLDHVVRIHSRSFTVIGAMPSYIGERNFQVFVPLRAAAATTGATGPVLPSLMVHANTLESVHSVEDMAVDWLASRYRHWEQRVEITSSAERLQQAMSALAILKFVMGALAAVSLIVGGVGIMNVLLASVAERTREIGVRKALGARRRDILYQFLSESVIIAATGSALGTAIGLTVAFGLAAIARSVTPVTAIRAVVTGGTLATAVVSAALIGLSFGIIPALRAARLSPIDAMRHE